MLDIYKPVNDIGTIPELTSLNKDERIALQKAQEEGYLIIRNVPEFIGESYLARLNSWYKIAGNTLQRYISSSAHTQEPFDHQLGRGILLGLEDGSDVKERYQKLVRYSRAYDYRYEKGLDYLDAGRIVRLAGWMYDVWGDDILNKRNIIQDYSNPNGTKGHFPLKAATIMVAKAYVHSEKHEVPAYMALPPNFRDARYKERGITGFEVELLLKLLMNTDGITGFNDKPHITFIYGVYR